MSESHRNPILDLNVISWGQYLQIAGVAFELWDLRGGGSSPIFKAGWF